MAKTSSSTMMASLVILGLLLVVPTAEALTCAQTVGYLARCLVYLSGRAGGVPPVACCNGVRALNAAAKGTPARQAACACLKQTVAATPGLVPGLITSLPIKCGVRLPFVVSPSTDCTKVT